MDKHHSFLYAILLSSLALAALTSCASAPRDEGGEALSTPANTSPAAEIGVVTELSTPVDGWKALRDGEVAQARGTFEALRADESRAMEGRTGLLRVAQISGDKALAEELIAELPPENAGAFLEVTAAQTALSFDIDDRALFERACAHREDYRVGSDAMAVCARAALLARYPEQNLCSKGCDRVHSWPLRMAGSAPMITASVAGAKPAPFLVDTGASSSVLSSSYARTLGLSPVEGTSFEAGSSGGGVMTALSIADIRIGDFEKKHVPFIVLDLPMEGIAGVLSPQALFSDFVVVADFTEAMTLSVHPQGAPVDREGYEVFDLFLDQGVVQLVASLGERPTRPLLVDTGADRTRINADLAAMAEDLQRGPETVALSAGGQVKTWQTRGRIEGRAKGLVWSLDDPMIYEPAEPISAARMHWQGMLGMDFLIGRTLILDRSSRTLAISRAVSLEPWEEGSRHLVKIEGSLLESSALVEEVVHAHDGEVVTLDVTITRKDKQERFRVSMRDSWASRGSWLLTRPIEKYWVVEGDGFVERPIEDGLKTWMEVFSPFRFEGRPSVSLESLKGPRGTMQCSVFEASALAYQAKPEQAILRIWECPGPWRVVRLELKSADQDGLLWGFEETERR